MISWLCVVNSASPLCKMLYRLLIYTGYVEVQQLLKYRLSYGHASPTKNNNHKYPNTFVCRLIEAVNG